MTRRGIQSAEVMRGTHVQWTSVRAERQQAASGAEFSSCAWSLSLQILVVTGHWGISTVLPWSDRGLSRWYGPQTGFSVMPSEKR